jgi:hypothetical protein
MNKMRHRPWRLIVAAVEHNPKQMRFDEVVRQAESSSKGVQ